MIYLHIMHVHFHAGSLELGLLSKIAFSYSTHASEILPSIVVSSFHIIISLRKHELITTESTDDFSPFVYVACILHCTLYNAFAKIFLALLTFPAFSFPCPTFSGTCCCHQFQDGYMVFDGFSMFCGE